MAIGTNYTTLQAALTNFLAGRTDLASRIPEFIELTETRIFYGCDVPGLESEPLRCQWNEQRDTAFSINGETVNLPTGLLEIRSFFIQGNPKKVLTYMDPQSMNTLYVGSTTAKPAHYTIESGVFRFAPAPDATYTATIDYYYALDPLATTATNNLLSNAPGVYLYGALIEAMPFTRKDERMSMWYQQYRSIINALNGADRKRRYSGSLLVQRPDAIGA